MRFGSRQRFALGQLDLFIDWLPKNLFQPENTSLPASKRQAVADRNKKICAMREAGVRIKEIATVIGVRDHVVAKALRRAGLTNPHEGQMGTKPSHAEQTIQRGPCLACRKLFFGSRWQFRCDDCLRQASKICVL